MMGLLSETAQGFDSLPVWATGGYATALRESWETSPAKQSKPQIRRKLRTVQAALAVASYLFREVRNQERSWLGQVAAGVRLFDARDEEVFRAMYAQWFEPVCEVQSRINELQGLGRKVGGAKTFARQSEEVARILRDWPNHRNPRPVRIDELGRMFEVDGRAIFMPGLTPNRVQEVMEVRKTGQYRTLAEIAANRKANGI